MTVICIVKKKHFMLLWSFTIVNSIVKKKTYFSLLSAVVVDFPTELSPESDRPDCSDIFISLHPIITGPGILSRALHADTNKIN